VQVFGYGGISNLWKLSSETSGGICNAYIMRYALHIVKQKRGRRLTIRRGLR